MATLGAAMKDASPTTHDSPRENHHGKLACQACQRKKIKCDRNFPCGQCQKSNLHCTQSARKQRVRHAGKRAVDGELRTRISKLESLVESLSGEASVSSPPVMQEDGPTQRNGSLDSTPPSPSVGSPAVGKYVAGQFWSSLSSEVQALREVLEDDQDGETPDSGSHELSPPSADAMSSLEYDLIVCPPGRIYVMPGALSEPTHETSLRLFDVFLENVEPMYKVFHRPTLVSFMQGSATYLGRPRDSPANLALKRSVWFSAVCSLGDKECYAILGQSKDDALNHFKRLVGISLAQADMINTTEMATVQAFATYLASSRQTDSTRRVWTLVAILVRIAKAMVLHVEDPRRSPFDIELRRRLWHSIRFMDVYCAIDRGSEPLISPGSHSVPLPTSTNDADFDEYSASIPRRDTGLADTSFAIMTFEACDVAERLNAPEVHPGDQTWERRHEIARELGDHIRQRYLGHCDLAIPYERLRYAIGESMSASMILRAVRPMQRHVSSTPPRVDSPYVLQIAIDTLAASKMVYSDPETQRWNWMTWVPWHALAVALAGLCSIRGNALADRAWGYVEKQYERTAPMIADSKEGMLWKPIEKLYKKASAFRDAGPSPMPSGPQNRETALPPIDPAITAPVSHQNAAPLAIKPLQTIGQVFPTSTPDMNETPRTLPPLNYETIPIDPSFNAMDGLSSNMSGLDPFPNDTSWLDWEQMMNDFAANGELMTGMEWADSSQPHP